VIGRFVRRWRSNQLPLPDANDSLLALLAYTISDILKSHGVKVPEQVSLTGFDHTVE
jgi:DNA-binding LacI/PurR family transcriptional regulator